VPSARGSRSWPHWTRRRPDAELAHELAASLRSGLTLKLAARKAGLPPGIVRQWYREGQEQLERIYEREDETGYPGEVGMFYAILSKAAAELAEELVAKLREAGAGKESAPGSAGWLLERLESDFNLASRVEFTGPEGGPLEVEGRVAVGWADLIAIAQATGQGHLLGLPGGGAGRALPAADEVLPDPADAEPAAVDPPGLPGA